MEYLVRLDKEIAELKQELASISWYMRGGVNYHDLLYLYSYDDRAAMYKVINNNLKLTKETQMPLL